MNILKVISVLMNYPTEELQQFAGELTEEVRSAREIPPELREQMVGLVDSVCRRDLMEVQEEYGVLFDRGRSVSLLMFEHVHGESRDRGQAMVDLMSNYERNGYDIAVRELPDYIPLYLEFLAQRPEIEARQGLADVGHIFGVISARLQERQSLYSVLFDALLIIGGTQVDIEKLKAEAAAEERDDTMEAMDKVWEEEQVTFMANQSPEAGCRPQTHRPPTKNDEAVPITWMPSELTSSQNH
ncbi:nitrate reductase molybdenum cofactor assembly chaperone [Motiliproteus sp. MSK22-1]|uniref:nitrate reductase molybdenum cofactor assembly chaperone n=1 Tax=Motiliproteus sp. MSK22-1 TaxID=1897630 RepID=UPI0009755B94|nr:nitrate reductase molybdenum cofactor assembly chaperone [Motiliproteus sp. MSK22-1]OMH39119.1 nitrate reductase molybdenum cofactor assembly chaperone [Motiliproteus sp. MSK22-1]